jgi:hypothetical protein
MTSTPSSSRQVFLGVFIVGQILFLISSNFIGFLKDNRAELGKPTKRAVEAVAPGWTEKTGHLWHLMEHVAQTDKMWAQATGQFQIWSLFAPTIGRECVFPALELRWDDEATSAAALARPLSLLAAAGPLEAACLGEATDMAANMPLGPELARCENEPADLDRFLRIGNFRMRRYENNLVITLRPYEDETPEETNKRWSESIRSHVADYSDILQGYLRWRVAAAMEKWPGRERPRQVTLVLRRFHINDYEKSPPYWSGPHTVPLARWQPAATWDAQHQPLEWYDPVSGRFKGLSK